MYKFFYLILLLVFQIEVEAKFGRKKGQPRNVEPELKQWNGKWFPFAPDSPEKKEFMDPHTHHVDEMGECDDGLHNVEIDYDPKDSRHSQNYLCFGKRSLYEPNLQRAALLTEHYIPRVYMPPIRCLNETISYENQLPTYGEFRPIAPKYGTYQYLPPQRWLRVLAEGAIVFTYHPCAYHGQIALLKQILESCLYRHIVTPTQGLTSERPLALIAWGKILQMSVVDKDLAMNFIKNNAKKGPLKYIKKENERSYDVGRISEAHLVTDLNDTEICGFTEI